MGTIALIITSIFSIVLQNALFNKSCKGKLTSAGHIDRFNIVVYTVCAVIFGRLLLKEKLSLFTVGFALLFGIVTALNNYYKMLALANGPMHITLLVTTSSMIIPTLSGIFFGETFSIAKLLIVFALIWFIYLSIQKSADAKFNKKWFFTSALAFLFQGTVGVLQKIHQSSAHREEVSGFLFVSFLCALVFCFLRNKNSGEKIRLDKSLVIFAVICGGCAFAMNFINLKLSGLLPSQLFFPLINGSAIVLSSAMSVVLFKEQLSKRQTIGLVGGILCLIGICLVP